MRLIDLEELMKFPIRLDHYDKVNGSEEYVFGIEAVLEYAEYLPTIDAVPVVRCKDCKHRRHLQGAADEANVCGLGWGLSGIVAEEDFCSYGKRRDEDAAD